MRQKGVAAKRFQEFLDSPYKVAVLAPIPSGAPGEVLYGVKQLNDASEKQFYTVLYFSLGLDNDLVMMAAHEALADEYPVIVSLGFTMTEMIYSLTKDMPSPPAIVFALTGRPVRAGFIASMQSSQNHMVGVEFGQEPTAQFVEHFMHVRGDAGKVMLAYTAPRYHDKAVERMVHRFHKDFVIPAVKELQRYGVTVDAMPFATPEDSLDELKTKIQDYDTLIILTGDALLNLHGAIGALCEKHNVVFCANFRSAVRSSASFGYAQSYIEVGHEIAHRIQDIFFRGKKPSELSTMRIPDRNKLLINTAIAKDQGLDPEVLSQRAGKDAEVFERRGLYPVFYDESR